jgi:glycosyltransferase involved in cell wall biosynthesis
MKIAVIAPTGIPSRRANSIQVMKMMEAFTETGHDARLAAPGRPMQMEAIYSNWNEIADLYGIRSKFPITWINANPGLRRYDFAWQSVRWARAWRPDLIYSRLPQAAAVSSLIGLDTILESHDLPQGRMGPLAMRWFLKGKGSRRLVVISHALAADLAILIRGLPSDPFTIVAPDGVDLARYADLPKPEEARNLL